MTSSDKLNKRGEEIKLNKQNSTKHKLKNNLETENPISKKNKTVNYGNECIECGAVNSIKAKFCVKCGKDLSNKKCSKCGTVNSIKAKFCIQCSKPLFKGLKITCPQCGTENTIEAIYCHECAYNLKPQIKKDGEKSPSKNQGAGVVIIIILLIIIILIILHLDATAKIREAERATQEARIAADLFEIYNY